MHCYLKRFLNRSVRFPFVRDGYSLNRCLSLKVGFYNETFISQVVNFSFDSFLSTFNTWIQLRNVDEIFPSTIMNVFYKGGLIRWNFSFTTLKFLFLKKSVEIFQEAKCVTWNIISTIKFHSYDHDNVSFPCSFVHREN